MFAPLQSAEIGSTEKSQMDMFKKLVAEKAIYFSYDYDLTTTCQAQLQRVIYENDQKIDQAQGVFTGRDRHFILNSHQLSFEGQDESPDFFVPCIYGYIYIHTILLGTNKCDYIMVSRKDSRRLGRRFTCRGLDKEGAAANYVETEQMVIDKKDDTQRVASYLQTRGSIPLVWTQTPTLKYNPKLKIGEDAQLNEEVAKTHLTHCVEKYGKNVLVNLIDKKGSQKTIGEAFTQMVNRLNMDKIHYTWFDFHHECRKMKWENIGKLIEEIKPQMNEMDYFMASLDRGLNERASVNSSSCIIQCLQQGVVRTNCMDCLDRTNVVQSVIARNIAHKQLFKMQLIERPKGQTFERFPDKLEDVFRESWTNNANMCSILYTGTPALKTDFTRTGVRTMKGALDDGKNSVIRYYINNFTDGYNQDCLDFVTNKVSGTQLEDSHKGIGHAVNSFLIILGLVSLSLTFSLEHSYLLLTGM